MRKMKKIWMVLLVLTLAFSTSLTAFAVSKKQSILDEMMAAATDLGVQNSVQFKNAYTSVQNYEGTITDEQYQAALDEIAVVKNSIASKGVDAVRNDESLKNELINHVVAAAKAVGITIVYEGNGAGNVVSNSQSNSSQNISSPIKQTGSDYTAAILTVLAIAAVFAGCVFTAKKKHLYA